VEDFKDFNKELLYFLNEQLKIYGGYAFTEKEEVYVLALKSIINDIQKMASKIVVMTAKCKVEFPNGWDHAYDNQDVTLITISNADPIYATIKAEMDKVQARIIQIHRIQAMTLWRRYYYERLRVSEINNGNPNELLLIHGTRGTPPEVIYNGKEGFDMMFAHIGGTRGGGIYFAPYSSYSCNGYEYRLPNNQSQVFFAKVTLGTVAEDVDANRLMPPVKPGTNMRYDSVRNGPTMYIVYSNSKAYPMYLVTYTK